MEGKSIRVRLPRHVWEGVYEVDGVEIRYLPEKPVQSVGERSSVAFDFSSDSTNSGFLGKYMRAIN